MIHAIRTPTKTNLAVVAIVAFGLMAGACATHPHPHPPRTAPSTWGGDTPPPATPLVYAPASAQSTPQARVSANGRSTFTQGCTGSFSVFDTRSNREISRGRAYNSGNGLIALDNQGRQTRAVSSSSSQSVTFLPDCNCRAGNGQSGTVSSSQRFAATPPSAATCAAG